MAVLFFGSAAYFGRFGHEAGPGVFGEGTQRGVSQPKAGSTATVGRVGVRENAEARRVAFKMLQVGHFGRRELGEVRRGRGAGKIAADGVFAGMAKGRVADVVGEAGSSHDVAAVLVEVGQELGQSGVVFQQLARGQAAQGAAHHGGFEGVGEARVHEVGFGQGHHLGFPLQAPKGGAEHHPVSVLHKSAAHGSGTGRWQLLVGEAALREQARPLHGFGHKRENLKLLGQRLVQKPQRIGLVEVQHEADAAGEIVEAVGNA